MPPQNASVAPTPSAALVTGASTGIGQDITRFLADRGWTVFAGVRKTEDAHRLKSLQSDRIIPVFLDVTQPEQIKTAVSQIQQSQSGSGLNGLVNNAGIAVSGPLEFLSMQDLRYQYEVNFLGQIAVTQAMLPLLRQRRGRIVNMSSISGRVAMPFLGPYASSKFALEAFSDSLRLELRPWKMPVILIEPGAVETPIWEKSIDAAVERVKRLPNTAHQLYKADIHRMLDKIAATGSHGIPVEQVSAAVFHALTARRPKVRYYLGRGTRAAALFARLAPDRFRDWVIARLTGFNRQAEEITLK
jgi:NAD(P)-dependent dehydrogenase (short-subunit alcohol dehydrogenase family)